MDEETKRRVDALMQLVDFRTKRIADRRSHEWPVTIGLWALLGAGIVELSKREARALPICFLAIVLTIMWLLHVAWVSRHWFESRIDEKISFLYADTAQRIVEVSGIDFEWHQFRDTMRRAQQEKSWIWKLCGWALTTWPPILTTALFAIALWYVNAR